MSAHDDLFAASALPQLFDQFSGEIEVTPPGGQAVTLQAMLSPETSEERPSNDGRTVYRVRSATITLDPACEFGGIAEPKPGSIVKVGELQYRVAKITGRDACVAVLNMERPEVSEVARPEYRAVPSGRSFE